MISYFCLWYHRQYHKNNYKKLFLRYCHRISYMILTMILLKSYVFGYDIMYLWFYSWYHGTFHTIKPMISVTYDINAVWYHTFRDIVAYIMAPGRDILAYIMAPGRRDGAGWGRHAPAAPPPPASPSPTYWGRVMSWTATDLIQLLSNCLLYTQAYSHSHSNALSLSPQTRTWSRCHRHGDWKQAYRDPHHHHGGRCAQAVALHQCTSANNSIGRHCEENKINPI